MANGTPADALPVTALVPDRPGEPIVIYEPQAALRIAIVERDFVGLLDTSWDVPGIYCLLYPINGGGRFEIYVGKAPMGLRNRVSQHVAGKADGWVRGRDQPRYHTRL